ncbi:hypothetical protein [Bosea sp. (in: a-proteobacteria)]|uniref:hypothetical protein n=1 Tax=Bosea sp. (in: a-proteobacteria) TaxID=1871050 RepID=UPI00262EE587|nr:hypothetical protein [Bosea sp. (in: a-proteobacteria)]MCO5092859.1 hypothetical protein [Bosea sp. (in: a-proteobacteria)]
MEILVPLLIGLSLIWLIGRGVPWNAKLTTIAVTLAIIVDRAAGARGLLAAILAPELNPALRARPA